MKTGISTFCEACADVLAALPSSLETTAAELARHDKEGNLAAPLATVNDLRARFRLLVDKLHSQQAYLLIFGPLKSGKSTLMNALSGAYVSEVTSLPGYPCLVYVQHAEEKRISATRYNGRESVFASTEVLKTVMADAHLGLAKQLRESEERNDPFNPMTDYPETIRRIDVKLPVPALAESATVLVDTPGLYSRMNFGYDTLTREFRDSAACAVFVVKTDNLFLEQVFEEFNQLLNLFSRIFLVINVDSSKRDLGSQGELLPSAESINPDEIVEAFTTLSMAGPLRQAYEGNRVRIHALDLMNSASRRLGAQGDVSGREPDEISRRFDAFNEDLTNYLNSNDYIQEFMRDTLRQAQMLCAETLEMVNSHGIQDIYARHEELGVRLEVVDEKIAATERLLKVDWESAFQKNRAESAQAARSLGDSEAASLTVSMQEVLERWFASEDSLQDLQERIWTPLIAQTTHSLEAGLRNQLLAVVLTPFCGAEISSSTANDLQKIGLSLPHISAGSLAALRESESLERYGLTIDAERLLISRKVADWFFFRSQSTLRELLFGPTRNQAMAPDEKSYRLTKKARPALLTVIREDVHPHVAAAAQQFTASRLQSYITGFCAEVRATLECQREQLRAQRNELADFFAVDEHFVQKMKALAAVTGDAVQMLEVVARREGVHPVAVPEAPRVLAFDTPSHAAA